jgi:HAD superfamily hydrolase (TIGR01549 family)
MKKKIGIFDIDGTLVDGYEAISATFNYSLKLLGYPAISLENVRNSVGGGSKNLALKFVKEEDVLDLMRLYQDNQERFLKGRVKLLEGSKEFLTFLMGQGIILGVATNRTKESAKLIMEELSISRYFDIISTTDDVKEPKPAPDMIQRIINAYKVTPEEVFFVGDMDIDFFAGQNAGVDTYIVATGSSSREELEKLNKIDLFDNMNSLKEYFKRWFL